MTLFKGFYNFFMKPFTVIIVLELLSLIFFNKNIVCSILLGTGISVLMAFSWYSNYYHTLHDTKRYIRTGTITRVVLVLLACIIWYRFRNELNMIAILIGLMLMYIIIFVNAVRHFTGRKR